MESKIAAESLRQPPGYERLRRYLSRECGGGSSAASRPVKIGVEADDGKIELLRSYILVSIVKIKVKMGSRIDHFPQFYKRQRDHGHSRRHIRQKLAKCLGLLATEKNHAYGVKGVIGYEQLMSVRILQKVPGLLSFRLSQQQLEENVGID